MKDRISLKLLRPFFLVIHHIKVMFRNLKLHWKIQILFLIPAFIGYFAAIILFDYSLNLYDQRLYQDSASILSLSTQNIENEMHNLFNITTQLSTDTTLQNHIIQLERSATEYEQYTCRQQLMNQIYTSLNTRKYILSVTYISPSLRVDTVGSDTTVLLEKQAEKLYDTAFSNNGKASWINDSTTLLVCPIRKTKNLDLRPLGAIVIRINVNKLVDFTMNIEKTADDFFICRNENELIYRYDDSYNVSPDLFEITENYSVKKINGANTFIVQHKSKYSDWTYYYAIGYDTIFSPFHRMKALVFFLFSGLYILLTGISIRFSNSISRPLKRLAEQMNSVQNINFEISNISFGPITRKDEIGQLQRSYRFMVKKIEELIQKNYKNQILLQDTRYRVLQSQINPHFMYNTLDSVYWMAINEHQNSIATIVFSLGRLLRENMKKDALTLIPLRQELIILGYYLNIQQIRFAEHLQFKMVISDDAQSCDVPRMILQPLVENSINYGAEQISDICIIELSACLKQDRCYLEIRDNGIGVENDLLEKLKSGEKKPTGHGIGISNIEQRLQYIYGDDYCFSIQNAAVRGTVVSISFPAICRYSDKEAEKCISY